VQSRRLHDQFNSHLSNFARAVTRRSPAYHTVVVGHTMLPPPNTFAARLQKHVNKNIRWKKQPLTGGLVHFSNKKNLSEKNEII
jgi:hypothetical protein